MPGPRSANVRIHRREDQSGGRIHIRFGDEGEGREFASQEMLDAFCDRVEEQLRGLGPDLAVYIAVKYPNLRNRGVALDLDTPAKLLRVG